MSHFIENYAEIKGIKAPSFRSLMRGFALSSLSIKDRLLGHQKYLNTPRVQFLYIHHSFTDEIKKLELLMERLNENHTFISYSDAVDKILNNKIDKSYISISSDDGFKNNLYAAEVLNKYNAKACFFINPGLIDEKDFNIIKKHCHNKLHLPPIEFLSWKEVIDLQKQGHEIGAHTMYHSNIVEMRTKDIMADMEQSYQIIESKCGKVEHFAFPYGRFFHFNEAGRQAVFSAGYKSCASAERGCHINSDMSISNEHLCIRRDHIVLDWGINHILYFLSNNAKRALGSNNLFPY